MHYTLGLDFGTNSVRALVVRTADGREVGSGVTVYPSGEMGILLDPRDHHLARQHPGDYLEALTTATRTALAAATATEPGFRAAAVIGLGVDTTGSSPLPVDAHNRALGMLPAWREHLAAQCWLWKDHTSVAEAARITGVARELRPAYLGKCGNTYSSEWFWAKLWHCHNVAPEVFAAAASWVELADWVPAQLCGITDPAEIVRGVCAAGHKAMYHADWGGLPDAEFLAALDPALAALRPRLYTVAHDASGRAGVLSADWAARLGLPAGIPVGVGAFDVHYGAIGAGVEEGVLVKVMGTSTCDCAVAPLARPLADIPGICGIVPGSILPGFYGLEAGQSAVGDIFHWWVDCICEGGPELHGALTAGAAQLRPGESGLLALDWNNGNRTILVDQRLTGLLLGQTLHTRRAEVYRALVEATAFGARVILDRFREYGAPFDRVICAGGIARKNAWLMQVYADILQCPLEVSQSDQTCALGSAMVAAVVAGAHPDFATARARMAAPTTTVQPNPAHAAAYHRLYALYRELHDAFGGVTATANLGRVMKDLLDLKTLALAS